MNFELSPLNREPADTTKNVKTTADGRGDWIGRVELAKEPTGETSTRRSARVIKDVNADIIGVVEAEDRPALARFNEELLGGLYRHVMLVDGNDERGIDVGIMTKANFEIESIRSNVDEEDAFGTVFSRDCPRFEVRTSAGAVLHVPVNHFKSQSGGGGPKGKRQATGMGRIINGLVAKGEHEGRVGGSQ